MDGRGNLVTRLSLRNHREVFLSRIRPRIRHSMHTQIKYYLSSSVKVCHVADSARKGTSYCNCTNRNQNLDHSMELAMESPEDFNSSLEVIYCALD